MQEFAVPMGAEDRNPQNINAGHEGQDQTATPLNAIMYDPDTLLRMAEWKTQMYYVS